MCKNPLHTFVKVLIVIGMVGGVAVIGLIFARWVPAAIGIPAIDGLAQWRRTVSAVLAALCVLGCEFIGWTLFGMMRSLDRDPFVTENVQALRKMGVAALIVMVLGLSTLLFAGVPLAVIGALPVGMCGLFSLVLAQVFEKAVAFKQENDLTV